MPRLILVFAWHTFTLLVLSCRGSCNLVLNCWIIFSVLFYLHCLCIYGLMVLPFSFVPACLLVIDKCLRGLYTVIFIYNFTSDYFNQYLILGCVGNKKLMHVFSVYRVCSSFLTHLSRGLTRWAYSISMVCHPSVVHSHFRTWISLRQAGQCRSNFICSITGVGEKLCKVFAQIGSNTGFRGTGGNVVRLIVSSYLIGSSSNFQVTKTVIKSRMSSILGQIRLFTSELLTLERWKIFP